MTEPKPLACSLDAGDLRGRLDEIAALGSESLIAHEAHEGTHVLRFRRDEETNRRLAGIITAETECCSFLNLDLHDHDGELVLTISAPEDGQVHANELASAFVGGSR